MRPQIRLTGPLQRQMALKAVENAPDGYVVAVGPETRTQEQNRKLWAMLRDVADQATLNDREYPTDHWKIFMVSGFRGEMPHMGLNGEPVMLSTSTSAMTKSDFAAFIEYIYATGIDLGVIFSDPAMAVYEEYRDAN